MSNNCRVLTFCLFLLTGFASPSLWAQDAALVQSCAACHGEQGISPLAAWPNLAGQKAEYLKQQLLNYRSGKRKHLLMQVIAGELTDAGIDAVSEYFSRH